VEGSWVVSGAAEVAGAVASAEVGACEVAGAASEERNVSISSWQSGGTVKASRSVCVWCLPVCLCICLCSSPTRSRAFAPERVQGGSKEVIVITATKPPHGAGILMAILEDVRLSFLIRVFAKELHWGAQA